MVILVRPTDSSGSGYIQRPTTVASGRRRITDPRSSRSGFIRSSERASGVVLPGRVVP